jgi:superfamily II DNA or RNA helicase
MLGKKKKRKYKALFVNKIMDREAKVLS